MSKTMIGVIVAIVVIVGGYFIYNANKGGTDVSDTTSDVTSSAQTSTDKAALAELIKKGGTLTCTITQNVNNTKVTGTMFMGSGMMRGEYTTKVQNVNIDSNFIVRDGFTYTWSSMTPNAGFKVAIPAVGSTASTANTSSFDVSQVEDYKCEAWTLDASKFTLPAGVTFTQTGAN